MSGGNSSIRFASGFGYYKESTVFPGNFADQKYSTRFSLDYTSPNNKFRSSFSGSYLIDDNNLFYADLTSNALTLPPNAPTVFDSLGRLNWENGTWNNPYAILQQKFNSQTNTFMANEVLSYEILNGLLMKINLGFNKINLRETTIYPSTSLKPNTGSANTGSSTLAYNLVQTWIAEPQLSYSTDLGPGKLSSIVGLTFQQNQSENEAFSATGFTSDELLKNIKAGPSITVSAANKTLYRYNAIFGRLNYNIKGKYLLNLTGRRDGSSRFGPGRQFANFGAIGAAWIFSAENAVQDKIPLLSFGKIRGSIGTTGSDQIGDYGFYDLWNPTFYPYGGTPALSPNNLFNPDYAWEINKKIEFGIELGILKDRISFAANYYRNRSSNQLVGYTLPYTTGFSSVQFNLPANVQNTGLEITLTTTNIQGTAIQWTTSFNMTIPRNKLISYPDIATSTYEYQYEVGKSLGIVKAFHSLGVDPQTGIYEFQDVNDDGTTGDYQNDLQSFKQVGQKFYGGIQNTISFKGLQLELLLQFVNQTGRNYYTTFTESPGRMSNQPDFVLNRWRKAGDITNIQKFSQGYGDAYLAYNTASSWYGDNTVSDATFLRLKTISLSYELPSKWNQRMKLQKSKFFMQGQNLLTITNFSGMDPENMSTRSLPL